jgi:hypothetical protein
MPRRDNKLTCISLSLNPINTQDNNIRIRGMVLAELNLDVMNKAKMEVEGYTVRFKLPPNSRGIAGWIEGGAD